MTARTCGECKLCCYLLPTPEIGLKANTHCRHECRKGCAIYHHRPVSCQMWSCQWLLGQDVGQRPDRSGYVVDMIPDFVTSIDDETGEAKRWPVHQVWVDPARPDAHKAPALRQWLEGEGERLRMMAIVRWGNDAGMLLCPPTLSDNGQWHEKISGMRSGPPNPVGEVLSELSRQGIATEMVVDTGQATLRLQTGAGDGAGDRESTPAARRDREE